MLKTRVDSGLLHVLIYTNKCSCTVTYRNITLKLKRLLRFDSSGTCHVLRRHVLHIQIFRSKIFLKMPTNTFQYL